MKINKSHKLESAVSKDDTRAAIMQPFVQGGRCIATDGRMLASVPIETEEGEEVEGKKIPLDALKAARKASGKLWPDMFFTFSETHCSILGGASFPLHHIDVAAPKVAEIVSSKLEREDATFSVTLDVDLLKKLSEALGTERVTLNFKSEKDIITVLPSGLENRDNKAFGLLMPIRTK
jgi:hypothetical protein